ncbi:MAG: MOSC domain-containing protein [Actinomycetota bacterium]
MSEQSTTSVLAINVGTPRDVDRRGRPATTAIYKSAVTGPVRAVGVNLEGDDQADRQAHGGYDKAVYAYADEDRHWWESELGRPVEASSFGENLTVAGVDVTGAVIGSRWRIGTALFEVSEPRVPCWKLNLRMGDDRFIQKFNAAGRPGTYLRIIEEGSLEAGDEIVVEHVPDHGLTVGDVARMYRERTGVERILAVGEMSAAWKAWARSTLDRAE